MRRGEVRWGQLPPPIGQRPVVLPSRDSAYRVRLAVTVAPVTRTIRTIRNIPVKVALYESDGLPSRCVANLDDIATIPKTLIKRRIAVLPVEKMQVVEAAIRFALDLS